MTVVEFINIVKQQQLSHDKIKLILGELGEKISKNSISNIYTVAGFEIIDSRKKIIEPTANANYEMTLKEAIPLARALRTQQEKKSSEHPKVKVEKKSPPVEIIPSQGKLPSEFGERIQTNPFEIEQAAEAKEFILASLGLTNNELDSLKKILHSNDELNSNPIESIYGEIRLLGGRERVNKTYYISKEIIDLVAEFTEGKSVKVSQFVEVALLDAMKKYQ